jgi:hypothetical protein
MSLELQPIEWQEACIFIGEHHRHNNPPQGWKFGIAVNDVLKSCIDVRAKGLNSNVQSFFLTA